MPGSTMVSQTLDGSFLDLMRNARDLSARCGLSHVPEVCSDSCPVRRRHIPLGAGGVPSAGIHANLGCCKVSCCCSLL